MIGLDSLVRALTVAAASALLAWLIWRWWNRRLLALASRVPGPPALPLLGNALLFMSKPNAISWRPKANFTAKFCFDELDVTPLALSPSPLDVDTSTCVFFMLNTDSINRRHGSCFAVSLTAGDGAVRGGFSVNAIRLHISREQLKIMGDLLAEYGEYVRFWLGPDLNIVVSNPNDIKLLLTSNKVNQKGPVYDHMKPVIGPGILTGGDVWRNHRKIATPSYNKKSVAAFTRVFNMEAASLAEQLCCKEPGKTFNVYVDVVNSTTQCVCQTLMGLSKHDSQNLQYHNEWVKETPRMYDFFFAKMTKWWLQIPLIFWLVGAKKKHDYYKSLADRLAGEVVTKRRKALERNEGTDEEIRSVVDSFILSRELSDQEIKWETITLFTTSQEASAKIGSAIILVLAHLPEWQTKVYNEIQDCLGTEDEFITEDQIKNLHYLDMVFKEVLRYLSIAALIQRTVQEEITINSGKIVLPVGTSLAIPIHLLHRDPRYWPEPNRVMPERFHPENEKLRDQCTFVPFSLGHMDCLGRVYATTLIKTLVVRVLRHVRFEADGRLEDLSLDVAISVSFTDGYNVRAYPRRPKTRAHAVA